MTFPQYLVRIVDAVNEYIGRAISWLTLFMVIVQFIVVVMRYVFGIGSIFMQESIVYMHATVFLVAAGYTLLHEGHVRIDIFYNKADPRTKAFFDLAGVLGFLLPVCVLIFTLAWPYVAKAWRILEVSQEGSGIPGVFLLKTVILIYACLLFIQGLSMGARASFVLIGLERAATKPDDGEEVAI